MTKAEYPYAGLVLPDATDLDPAPYVESAARVLARLDPVPGKAPSRSVHADKVFGRRYGIHVIPEEQSVYGPRVLLEVITTDGEPLDDEKAARILSDTVLAALDHSSADILEWYSPDVLLDRDDFVRLRSYVSPHRMPELDAEMENELFEHENLNGHFSKTSPETPTPEPVEERLNAAELLETYVKLEPQEPVKRRLSVAGYMMTGVLGMVYFPAAVFVYIASLRGMDFRLAAQTLAVTCLFSVLHTTHRLDGVMSALVN
ncbi:hypothetical protein [Sagittula stellata]|uniref:Uncharacterized protein n=1 Tax=Sagittula stellata (strain ATCC 700073 / DSM 11524 / E-37) TaxID=388399 RepID=A3JZC4_SAGS3|nr:hypothetical protein [Sagittula stellata]EBA09827.1 hypothetical protein SSE37_08463 [Sagittula stellata E-37]